MDDKGVVSYHIAQARLLDGHAAGCHLCGLLVDLGVTEGSEAEVEFQIDQNPETPIDEPADAQYLIIYARRNGLPDISRTYCMYTAAGLFTTFSMTWLTYRSFHR